MGQSAMVQSEMGQGDMGQSGMGLGDMESWAGQWRGSRDLLRPAALGSFRSGVGLRWLPSARVTAMVRGNVVRHGRDRQVGRVVVDL